MLFIHANLVTMEPAPQGFLSIPDGFLLTEGSRIAALGPMSDCPDTSAFSSEEVFDLKGNPAAWLYRRPLPHGSCRRGTQL